MYAYELPLNPPVNCWLDYQLPTLCHQNIKTICADIIRHGEYTRYQKIYDAIYEIIEGEINHDREQMEIEAYE